MVQRTKEELTLAFFEQFRNEVNATNEFRTLLPNTNFLLQTQEDVFRIPSMGAVWVESFQSDIQNLLPNLERLILTDTAYQDLAQKPMTQVFRLAFNLVDLSLKGEKPLNTLAILKERFGEDTALSGLSEILQTLTILGNELQHCEAMKIGYLLNPISLQTMTETQKQYFVSLLYRKILLVYMLLQAQVPEDFLLVLEKNYHQFLATLQQLSSILHNLEAANQQYYRTAFEKNSPQAYNLALDKVAKLSLNLLEFGFKLRYFAKPDAYYQSPFYQEYYPIALNTVNAIGHIQRQEYGIFLLNLAQILQPIIEEK